MIQKIRQHLKDANKTYFEHQDFKKQAICLKSSFTLVHSICPALYEYNTSTNIKNA